MNKITMKTPVKLLILAFAMIAAAPDVSLVSQALAGEIELNDIQNAKLARHKARERVMRNEKQEDYLDDSSGPGPSSADDGDCGTVDIGNVVNNKGSFGGPKAIDVIITGDIINANNDCN